jgi:hypothetical protein
LLPQRAVRSFISAVGEVNVAFKALCDIEKWFELFLDELKGILFVVVKVIFVEYLFVVRVF